MTYPLIFKSNLEQVRTVTHLEASDEYEARLKAIKVVRQRRAQGILGRHCLVISRSRFFSL